MSQIRDTGKTADKPQEYNNTVYDTRIKYGGCIGAIACINCGAILSSVGSMCFCSGAYTCPRCNFDNHPSFIVSETTIWENHEVPTMSLNAQDSDRAHGNDNIPAS